MFLNLVNELVIILMELDMKSMLLKSHRSINMSSLLEDAKETIVYCLKEQQGKSTFQYSQNNKKNSIKNFNSKKLHLTFPINC